MNKNNAFFAKWFFKSNKWHKYIYLNGDNGARDDRVSIKDESFFKMPLAIPNNPFEQEKIVNFLNLIDKKIKYVNKKFIALKKYKKGISIKILKKLDSYDSMSLSKLCNVTTGKLDANAMTVNGKYKFFTCSREDYTINNYAFNCEALLISGNGEVGLTKYYKGKFNAYQRTYVLYNFKRNAKFIKMCIDNQISTVIKKETNKGAMPYIKLTTFDKILIPLISKSVENNIEDIINVIDKKIELLENSLKALNLIKKQLLNSMFI